MKRPRSRGSAAALVLAATGALFSTSACSVRSRAYSAAERDSRQPERSACVLFFDGLSDEAFSRLLAAGALPNLKSVIADRALRVETAVTSVPSETYPNLAALLTGLFPGHHGIPANIWLDRRLHVREAHTNVLRTYSTSDFLAPEARTLYERLPGETVAITAPIARGVTVHVKNTMAVMAAYARNDWPFLDRKTLDDMGDAYVGAAAAGRVPSLVWGHLLGPDEVTHAYGPRSVEFSATMEAIDRAFGRLVKRLKRHRLDERILFVVLGDHGNRAYETFVDANELVNRALRANPTEADCSLGNCVLVPATHKEKAYDVADALISVGAYCGVMIWLPGNRPPENLPTVFRAPRHTRRTSTPRAAPLHMPPVSRFAASLARARETGLVVTRGPAPGSVVLYAPGGRAEIVREDRAGLESLYLYRVLEGEDPLGYAHSAEAAPLVGSEHEAHDWLEATAHTEYPDLVVQLPEFFDSPRSPDVLLSPKNGFGFTSGKAAGHGSLSRSETVVPLLFAGPGVAPGTIRAARTVDLAPTLLTYLGVAYNPDEMDGTNLGIAPSGVPKPPEIERAPPRHDD